MGKKKVERELPLSGVRVLDLSQVLAGPYCAMLLAGLGADVVKVEAPEGDLSRAMGPPYVAGSGTLFLAVNRNKKSIVLDLGKEAGVRALHRLAAGADVVLHNFRPRAAKKLGVDARSLKRVNPRIISAGVAAFGQSGPLSEEPGLDAVIQAMGGLMSLTGAERGAPCKAAPSIVDVATGLILALGIVSALWARRKSGRGCRVEGSLLDTVLALQSTLFTYASVVGGELARVGNGSYYTVTDCFRTADGRIVISLPTSRFWARLCRALPGEGLDKDPRYDTNRKRIEKKKGLSRRLQTVFARRKTKEWLRVLRAEGVPCGPVLSYGSVLREPQVRHNGLFGMERSGNGRRYRVVRSPVRLDGALMDGSAPAPRLGEHTAEVLRAARFTTKEILDLQQQGVVVPRPPDPDRL